MRVLAATDSKSMLQACEEADRGLGHTSPNPAVGCVVVKNGRLVGRGFHAAAGQAHAEVAALSDAGTAARGATVYVTLEPCCVQGRTPACTEALIAAGVKMVVYGSRDPNPRVNGRGGRKLKAAGIEVVAGVEQPACDQLVKGYREWVQTGSPLVGMKLAVSLDGRIAARGGASKWISGPASRALVQQMRRRADAVLVGAGTVAADDPRLSCRLRGARQPLRVVLDERLSVSPRSRVVAGRGDCLLVCAPGEVSSGRAETLRAAGAEVYGVRGRGRGAWQRLLAELGRRDVHELLIEGGAGVAASVVKARVVSELTLFYSTRLLGGDGVPMLDSLGVRSPSGAPLLSDGTIDRVGHDFVWRGRFENSG